MPSSQSSVEMLLSQPFHESCGDFRSALLALSPRSRIVVVDTGAKFRLVPTPQGGSCGFLAVAWALLILAAPGGCGNPALIRKEVALHVRDNREGYARMLRDHHSALVENAEHNTDGNDKGRDLDCWIDRVILFESSVQVGGINGHWLGQHWGDLEILALARALRITIDLYAFDMHLQRVRRYFRADGSSECAETMVVSLLFTGKADCGHFDLLQEVLTKHSFRPRWSRRS